MTTPGMVRYAVWINWREQSGLCPVCDMAYGAHFMNEMDRCSEIVRLRAENERLRAICLDHDTDPEGCVECFMASVENRDPAPLPHGVTPMPDHSNVLREALEAAEARAEGAIDG